jgi:hypothetical protein
MTWWTIEHALNKERRKHELSKGKGSFQSMTLFTPSNEILNLSIHTSLMVMRTEKVISMFNSKMSKLQVYLLNKTRVFMWWKNHYVALWWASDKVIIPLWIAFGLLLYAIPMTWCNLGRVFPMLKKFLNVQVLPYIHNGMVNQATL